MEIVVCQSGLARHAPELSAQLEALGETLQTVQCFDHCDACERRLLARLDGGMARFRSAAELLEAVKTLKEAR